jgi:hypothetical protein
MLVAPAVAYGLLSGEAYRLVAQRRGTAGVGRAPARPPRCRWHAVPVYILDLTVALPAVVATRVMLVRRRVG